MLDQIQDRLIKRLGASKRVQTAVATVEDAGVRISKAAKPLNKNSSASDGAPGGNRTRRLGSLGTNSETLLRPEADAQPQNGVDPKAAANPRATGISADVKAVTTGLRSALKALGKGDSTLVRRILERLIDELENG